MRSALFATLAFFTPACFSGGTDSGSDAGPVADAGDPTDAFVPGDAGQCEQPLDEETLGRLAISMEPSLAMKPGSSRHLRLGVVECCYFFEPVEACATWSIAPTEGATIDPVTGRLEIDAATEHGTVYTVTADVEEGRRLVTIDVHVYTDEGNPLFGYWREDAQFLCGSNAERAPEEEIAELLFRADGWINVTWHPFEIYVDYWGPYTYDLGGALSIEVTGGNYVPDDIDGEGSFEIDDQGRLMLRYMWLGSPDGALQPAGCGHRFVRY